VHSDCRFPNSVDSEESWHGVARAWLQKDVHRDIQQWVDFHNHPTLQMHPEGWQGTTQEWRDSILECPLAQAYVDRHFRNLWGWKGNLWTSLESPLMRLAISDFSFLLRIATFAGALVAVKEIRRTIDRRTVLELRKGLGEDVLSFAYTTTLHCKMSVPQKCRPQRWPRSDGSCAIAVLNSGWLLIACACALLPADEWNRFLSRLPHLVKKDFRRCKFPSEDSQLAWQCLRKLLRVAVREGEGNEPVQIS
jgi:hypothetical protein